MRPSKTLARSTFFNIITHARFLPRHLSSLSLFVQAVTTLFVPFLPFFLSSRSVGNLVTLCDTTSKGRISLHLGLKLRQSCFWPLLFLALCPSFSVTFREIIFSILVARKKNRLVGSLFPRGPSIAIIQRNAINEAYTMGILCFATLYFPFYSKQASIRFPILLDFSDDESELSFSLDSRRQFFNDAIFPLLENHPKKLAILIIKR